MRRLAPACLLAFLTLGCTTTPPVVPGEGLRTTRTGLFEKVYPVYTADPKRPVIGYTGMAVLDESLSRGQSEPSDERSAVHLGGRIGLVRYGPEDRNTDIVQLELELGYLGWIDLNGDSEPIGYDQTYGLLVAWNDESGFAGQAGLRRVRSSLGDDFAARTGRRSVNYTRDEILLGASYQYEFGMRIYGEYGYAFYLENQGNQETGRAQLGFELESPTRYFGNRFAPYVALDVSGYKEDKWDPNWTLQSGLLTRLRLFNLRFGVEFFDGRPGIGEFARDNEQWVTAGVWADF